MLNFLQQHAALLISAFAVFISIAANWRVVRTEHKVNQMQKAARRMDMLVEIELKNAAVGKLALITARKLLLIQHNPSLTHLQQGEIDRLRGNLELLQDFQSNENSQREIAESAGGGDDIELHHKALADVRRLRVRLEADVEKETSVYQELVEQVCVNSA